MYFKATINKNDVFTTVLFWESELDHQLREVSFYTSEVAGPFEIRMRYVNSNGKQIEATEFFEVK